MVDAPKIMRLCFPPLVIALAIALAGCRCDEGSEPALAGDPITACARTLSAISELPPERLSEWVDMYGRGCAGLYREPRCREAWLAKTNEVAVQRTRRIMVTCADEYCPVVGPPAPAMCSMDRAAAEPSALTADWPEMHAAILGRDLGVDRDAGAVRALNRLFIPVSAPVERAPEAGVQPSATVIRVQSSTGGLQVQVQYDGGSKTYKLGVRPTDEELKRLQAEFKSESPTPQSRAVIEAHADAPYGAVMKILEAAKAAGYEKIALSTTAP
jgi:biopolymer transport protein ExbD